jgi:hypothetical protein
MVLTVYLDPDEIDMTRFDSCIINLYNHKHFGVLVCGTL